MLKATAVKSDGSLLLILGVTQENLNRLRKNEPILVAGAEMGAPGVDVCIVYGATAGDLHGLFKRYIGPDTVVKDQRPEADKAANPLPPDLGQGMKNFAVHEHGDPKNPEGPGGRYPDALQAGLEVAGAEEGMLMIVDGPKGPGFSVSLSGEHLLSLPSTLRTLATAIEGAPLPAGMRQ